MLQKIKKNIETDIFLSNKMIIFYFFIFLIFVSFFYAQKKLYDSLKSKSLIKLKKTKKSIDFKMSVVA